MNLLNKKLGGKIDPFILFLILAVAFVALIVFVGSSDYFKKLPAEETSLFTPVAEEIKKFSSQEEFIAYVKETHSSGFSWEFTRSIDSLLAPALDLLNLETGAERGSGGEMPSRVSETTVQVEGIDEPDIVKTDGKEIYFSRLADSRIYEEQPDMEIMPGYQKTGDTLFIKAFPPADLNIDSSIKISGNLFLAKNKLIIIPDDSYGYSENRAIYGYDAADPRASKLSWQAKLAQGTQIAAARLLGDKIYLIARNYIQESRPCPITPLEIGGVPFTVECRDIFHPVRPVPADTTFTVMILNPENGKIEKSVSFIGSSGSSVVYMSPNAVYITYTYSESFIKFFLAFLKEKGKGLYPDELIEKLNKINDYDISEAAKIVEFQTIIEKYASSLNDDEKLRLQNELNNRLSDYYNERKRDLEKTGIVKISAGALGIEAVGSVPGRPLNQFSLDEYQGNLRIAITVGGGSGWGWRFSVVGQSQSANDVYVLDSGLKIIGAAKNMGLTERIYSVRFVEDKGYVVTFREIDPFYVLDLSDPQNPGIKGELKIPGFSSYLHPISKDKILGIGRENWQVKISLFDVSSPQNPVEKAKYILDEGWSEVLDNHHAFLQDKKHQIFFLPGGRGAYIFSYKNDKLELIKAVSGITQTRRAIYLNDYLYIIADDKITVINEIDWEKIREFDLAASIPPATTSPPPVPTITIPPIPWPQF